MGKRTSVLAERESAKAYLQNLKHSVSPEDVAKIWGIGCKALVNLIEHSCLSAFRGRTVDGHQKWLIDRNAPVNLLNRINALLNEIFVLKQELLSPTDLYQIRGRKKSLADKIYVWTTDIILLNKRNTLLNVGYQ